MMYDVIYIIHIPAGILCTSGTMAWRPACQRASMYAHEAQPRIYTFSRPDSPGFAVVRAYKMHAIFDLMVSCMGSVLPFIMYGP